MRLALLGGNVARLHRELTAEADGAPVPGLSTLYRAADRDLGAGMRAGFRKGEQARRAFDVWLQRPKGAGHEDVSHRNRVWEGDHKQLSIEVEVEGRLCKPWVTWFIDCATCAICGLAVTSGYPSRESVLAALRSAILCEAPYGPFGGLPAGIRVDRGKDFLSRTVGQSLAHFGVVVGDLPGYSPWLKGTVEELNGAVEEMFLRSLPRYLHQPTLRGGKPVDPGAPAVRFEFFVGLLLEWVSDWNTRIPKRVLAGRTPEQAWLADPTPIDTVPAADLRLMMLEDDGRVRLTRPDGVQWRRRMYVGAWMNGSEPRRVRIRHMPHHEHEIEVFDAATGAHLGPAFLADAATAQQRAEVMAVRRQAQQELERLLKAAAKKRRQRYAAVTEARAPQPLQTQTMAEAQAELDASYHQLPRHLPRPSSLPLPPPVAGWVRPGEHPAEPATGPASGDAAGG